MNHAEYSLKIVIADVVMLTGMAVTNEAAMLTEKLQRI